MTKASRSPTQREELLDVSSSVRVTNVVVTDTWVAMGKEEEKAARVASLSPYKGDADMMALAKPDAIFLHCLPSFHDTNTTIGAEKCEQLQARN